MMYNRVGLEFLSKHVSMFALQNALKNEQTDKPRDLSFVATL